MKKILILITKAEIGGAQMSVFNLSKKLKEKGYGITVGYGEGEFLKEKLDSEKIKNIRFKHLKRTFLPYKNIRFILEIREYIKKNNIDILHLNSSNTLFAAIAAKLIKNKPLVVFTYRGLSIIDENYTGSFILKWIYWIFFKILLFFVDKQVMVSKQNQIQCQKIKLAKNDITIHNGLNPDLLNFLPKEQALNYYEKKLGVKLQNKLIIGSIGRLAYQKNYEFLIKRIKEIKEKYPEIICIVAGEGPDRKKYEEEIKKNKLENNFLLAGDIKEAFQYIKAFDIFVLPSRYEGLSITLIEALFGAIPILATEVGGAKEQLENAGLTYKLDNKEDFTNKMTKLIVDKDFRKKLSKKALNKSTFFTIEKTAQGYIKIFGN